MILCKRDATGSAEHYYLFKDGTTTLIGTKNAQDPANTQKPIDSIGLQSTYSTPEYYYTVSNGTYTYYNTKGEKLLDTTVALTKRSCRDGYILSNGTSHYKFIYDNVIE